MTWSLLAAGEDRLAAAAPFYGPFPAGADLSGTDAAVLAVYGGLDTRVNARKPTRPAALEAAGLEHEVRTFEGADHAFFNDTGPATTPRRPPRHTRRCSPGSGNIWADDGSRRSRPIRPRWGSTPPG